jgi:hypothetical protein
MQFIILYINRNMLITHLLKFIKYYIIINNNYIKYQYQLGFLHFFKFILTATHK